MPAALLALTLTLTNPVAFGDSITHGGPAARDGTSYIRLLESDLGPIDNRAVSGTYIRDQVEAIEAYTGSATLYVWTPGFNDMRVGTDLEIYEYWLRRGLEVTLARGATVYLGSCLPMGAEGYARYGGSDERVGAVNRLTAAVVVEYPNVRLVPFPAYEPALHTSEDLVHPDEAGHRVIYEAFRAKIHRLFLPLIAGHIKTLMAPGPKRGGSFGARKHGRGTIQHIGLKSTSLY